MGTQKVQAKTTITNRLGMHARPATAFVQIANTFQSDIQVSKETQKADAKSVMQVMMLAVTCGTEIKITAEGDDADQAIDALVDLVNRGFDEE